MRVMHVRACSQYGSVEREGNKAREEREMKGGTSEGGVSEGGWVWLTTYERRESRRK